MGSLLSRRAHDVLQPLAARRVRLRRLVRRMRQRWGGRLDRRQRALGRAGTLAEPGACGSGAGMAGLLIATTKSVDRRAPGRRLQATRRARSRRGNRLQNRSLARLGSIGGPSHRSRRRSLISNLRSRRPPPPSPMRTPGTAPQRLPNILLRSKSSYRKILIRCALMYPARATQYIEAHSARLQLPAQRPDSAANPPMEFGPATSERRPQRPNFTNSSGHLISRSLRVAQAGGRPANPTATSGKHTELPWACLCLLDLSHKCQITFRCSSGGAARDGKGATRTPLAIHTTCCYCRPVWHRKAPMTAQVSEHADSARKCFKSG